MLPALRLVILQATRSSKSSLAASCISVLNFSSPFATMPYIACEPCSTSAQSLSSNHHMPKYFAMRSLSSSADDSTLRVLDSANMSEHEFHKLADNTIHHLQDRIEAYLEDAEVPDADIEYGMGVLTVKLGTKGTFVVNKQSPNRQIWLSSPVSGPFRYDYIGGKWVYHRDGSEMLTKLEEEFKSLFAEELDLHS